jgi:hypothetical protein
MQKIITQSRIPIRSGLTSTGQIRGHISCGAGAPCPAAGLMARARRISGSAVHRI